MDTHIVYTPYLHGNVQDYPRERLYAQRHRGSDRFMLTSDTKNAAIYDR